MLTTVLKWVGTILTVGGALMTAVDVDPLNIYLFNAGDPSVGEHRTFEVDSFDVIDDMEVSLA